MSQPVGSISVSVEAEASSFEQEIVAAVREAMGEVLDLIKDAMGDVSDALGDVETGAFDDVDEAASQAADAIRDTADAATDIDLGSIDTSGLDDVSSAAQEAAESVRDVAEEAAEAESSFDGMAAALGGISFAAAGASAAAFGQSQADLNLSLDQSAIILGESRESMRDLVSEMTNATFPIGTVTEGIEALAERGISTREEMQNLLPVFDRLSDATGVEMARGIEGVGAALSGMGVGIEDAEQHLDTFTFLLTQTPLELADVERATSRFGDAFQDMGVGVEDVGVALATLAERGVRPRDMMRELQSALDDSGGSADDFFAHIDGGTGALDDVSKRMEDAQGQTQELADAFERNLTPMDRFRQFTEELAFKFGDFAPLLSGVGGAMAGLAPLVGGLIGSGGLGGLAGILGRVAGAARFLLGPVGLIIGGITLLLANSETLRDALGRLFETFMDVAGTLFEALAPAFDSVMEVVGTLAGVIGDVLGTVLDTLIDTLLPVLMDLLDTMIPIWEMVAETVGELAAALAPVIETMGELISAVLPPLAELLGAVLQPAIEIVSKVVGALAGVLSTVLTPAIEIVAGVVGGFANILNTVVTGALNAIQDPIGAVRDAFGTLIEAAGRVRDTAIEKFGELLTWIRELPGRVLSALGNVATSLVPAGRDFIQGLIEGFKQKFTDAVNWVKDLPGKLVGVFRRESETQSPSRLMMRVGDDFMAGLVVGIEEKSRELAPIIERVVRDAATAASAVQLDAPTITGSVDASLTGGDLSVSAEIDGADRSVSALGAIAQALGLAGEEASGSFAPALVEAGKDAAKLAQIVQSAAQGNIAPAASLIAQSANTAGAAFQTFANQQVNPAMISVAQGAANLANNVGTAINQQIVPAWQNMGTNVENVNRQRVQPVMTAVQGAVNTTAQSFDRGATMIGQHWDRVRENTAQPVRFMIGTVFNQGVVRSWNAVSEMLGLDRMNNIPVGFAQGGLVGVVRGQGGPTEDLEKALVRPGSFVLRHAATAAAGPQNLDQLAKATFNDRGIGDLVPVRLSPGETVLPPELVAMLGLDNLMRYNDNPARGPEGLFPNLRALGVGAAQRLSAGGLVKGTPAWEQLKKAHEFARAQHGKPYQWAGPTGPGSSFDCSGYMASIAAVIQGTNPWQRYWYTGSFGRAQRQSGPQGFMAGLKAGFSIGVHDDPGGPGGGHTAGTLGGVPGLPTVNVESGGSPSMVKYGTGAVGADHGQFPTKYHLPIIDGAFVSGGVTGSAVDMGALVRAEIDPIWRDVNQKIAGNPFGGKTGELNPGASKVLQAAVTEKLVAMAREASTFLDPGGSGVERWRPLVQQLLRSYGFPMSWESNTMRRMNQESGGDPNAVNRWDINWQNGTPSVGLMQVTRMAYSDHRDPLYDKGPYEYGVSKDPAANVSSAMRYAMARYGSLPAAFDRPGGYWHGGLVFDQGGLASGIGTIQKATIQPERILSPAQTRAFERLVPILEDLLKLEPVAKGLANAGVGVQLSKEAISITVDNQGLSDLLTQGFNLLNQAITREGSAAQHATERTSAAVRETTNAIRTSSLGGLRDGDPRLQGRQVISDESLFAGRTETASREEIRARHIEQLRQQFREIADRVLIPGFEAGLSAFKAGESPQDILRAAGDEIGERAGEVIAEKLEDLLRGAIRTPFFDDGGIAGGTGLMFKNVIQPERVLSPRQTAAFESLVPLLDRLMVGGVRTPSGFNNTGTASSESRIERTIMAGDIHVHGANDPERLAREAQRRLLRLLDN
ncbi:phage tail tape measure protein [Hoyosella altamirensis]|nr:phage tail tape measure protein [Hoyosella altamirensis]